MLPSDFRIFFMLLPLFILFSSSIEDYTETRVKAFVDFENQMENPHKRPPGILSKHETTSLKNNEICRKICVESKVFQHSLEKSIDKRYVEFVNLTIYLEKIKFPLQIIPDLAYACKDPEMAPCLKDTDLYKTRKQSGPGFSVWRLFAAMFVALVMGCTVFRLIYYFKYSQYRAPIIIF